MKIEKEEKRLAAIVAGEAVEDALNYFGTFDKLHAQGLITAENRQRIFLTAFQWAERGIAAYEGMTALQRAETDGRVAFVELYQKRAALAVGLAQWLPSWPIDEAGRALSQRMLEARKGGTVDLQALDQDLKAHLVQVDRAVEEIQPYIRAASEGIEKLGKQAYLKAYPALLGVLKPAMLALTKLRIKAFDLHKEQIWTLAHRLVVERVWMAWRSCGRASRF